MKCQSCGHDYPSTLTRCTVCGHLTARRTRSFSDSRLIEFPRQTRVASDKSAGASNVPAWRQEVTERVRQIKAKRNTTSVNHDESPVNAQARSESAELGTALEPARSSRDNSPLVEAALTRVRRAKQEGAGLAMPAVSGAAIKTGGKTGIIVDREATARALDPAEDPRAIELSRPTAETARSEGSLLASRKVVGATKVSPRKEASVAGAAAAVANRHEVPSASATAKESADLVDPIDAGPIEEIDPVDYLEAEVRKVDQSLAREMKSADTVPVSSHLLAGVTDLLTIAVSSAPFLALVVMISGTFSDRSTLIGSAMLLGVLAFFYLSLTQSLCGKTFGMMLTNTRIIETATGNYPSVQRALLRSLCYPVALAPAGIGLLWVAIDRRHRGWQDIISGTVVVQDF
jgi:uncharacterized RDD family membrane protein YckC